MNETPLAKAVRQFAKVVAHLPDSALDREWKWKAYDEGVRFAFFRIYQELRELAVRVAALRAQAGPAITTAQRILAQHHTAYRSLYGVLADVRDDELDRIPAEGEWPLRKALAHIVQVEAGFLMQIEYALGRERTGDGRPMTQTKEDFDQRLALPPYANLDTDQGTLEEILARYNKLHSTIVEQLAGLRDEELRILSLWWEGEPFEIGYRMHRWDAHLVQHTIQVEKTLAMIGHPPSEAGRLLRHIYGALGEVEGALIGAAECGLGDQKKVAKTITAYTKEITSIVQTPVTHSGPRRGMMSIEERAQQAIDQLLGDESLTDELSDAEAKILLDWSLASARRLCEQTADMDEAQAGAFLEAALPNLRRVIRRTNKLVAMLPYAAPEMIMDGLTGISEASAQMPGSVARPMTDAPTLAAGLGQLPPADALTRILSFLSPEDTHE